MPLLDRRTIARKLATPNATAAYVMPKARNARRASSIPSSVFAVPCTERAAATRGSIFTICWMTARSLVNKLEQKRMTVLAMPTTVNDMYSVQRSSCISVGRAAAMLNGAECPAGVESTPPEPSAHVKAGRYAWQRLEPTSLMTKQSMAVANSAVCAAAAVPPRNAAVAAHPLCMPTLTNVTKRNGTKLRSDLKTALFCRSSSPLDSARNGAAGVVLAATSAACIDTSGVRAADRG
mmetsp:Transcript_10246/g.26482  ORF Transcript_10246/g.26482 Transcript_10246/m.26482 type:complete len:236 (-) Transcript_10246:222-929(-)